VTAEPVASPPPVREPRTHGGHRVALRILGLVVVLAFWQVAATRGWAAAALPTPAQVWHALRTLVANGELGAAMSASVARVAQGLALGVGAGVAAGVGCGLFRRMEDLVDPTLQAVRMIPYAALVPFLIIWLGIGESSKVGLVAVASFFPIYLNTFGGIRAVDSRLVEAATAFGVTRRGLIIDVVIPSALPQMLVGLRQSVAVGWVALVVAEQINADHGLGALLNDARQYLQPDVVFVCLLVYAALGLAADLIIRLVERRTLVWRHAFSGA
jgi:sulfonate transport system permease protein